MPNQINENGEEQIISGSGSVINEKTQNITASPNITNISGTVNILPSNLVSIPFTNSNFNILDTAGTGMSGGCRFTLIDPITKTRIGIPVDHWTDTSDLSPMIFNIWSQHRFSSTISRSTNFLIISSSL